MAALTIRAEAKLAKEKFLVEFESLTPCVKCGGTLRRVTGRHECVPCKKETGRNHKRKNKVKYAAYDKQWRLDNKG